MTTVNETRTVKVHIQTLRRRQSVVTLSFLLFFFSIPHVLEDFA